MRQVKKSIFWFIIIIILILFQTRLSLAQSKIGLPIIANYSINEINTNKQVWSITQDQQGIMYFGIIGGIVSYDGVSWTNIDIENNSTPRSLSTNKNGRIFIGGTNIFGYLINDRFGQAKFISISKNIKDNNLETIWKVLPVEDTVYFFSGHKNIYKYYNDTLIKLDISNSVKYFRGFCIKNDIFAIDNKTGFAQVTHDSLKSLNLFYSVCAKNVYVCEQLSKKELLLGTRSDGLFTIPDFKSKKTINQYQNEEKNFNCSFNEDIKRGQLYSSLVLSNGNILLNTLKNGVFIMNTSGELLYHFNENSGISSNSVYCAYEDYEGNLWLGHEEGISKIELNTPFRKFDKNNGLEGSCMTGIYYNNNIYVGTSAGLYYLELDQNNLKQNFLKPLSKDYIYNLSYLIVKDKNSNKKELITSTLRSIIHIDNKNRITEIREKYGCYKMLNSKRVNGRVFLGHTGGISIIETNFENDIVSFNDGGDLQGFNEDTRWLSSDDNGNIWASTALNGIVFLKFDEQENLGTYKPYYYDTINGLHSQENNIVYCYDHKVIVATSNKLYQLMNSEDNPEDYQFIHDTLFDLKLSKKNQAVNRIIKDKKHNYWLGTNNGIIKIRFDTRNTPIIIKTPFKRLQNLDVNSLFSDNNDRIWFGAASNLFVFDNQLQSKVLNSFSSIIRQVKVNSDSLLIIDNNFKQKKQITNNTIALDYKYNTVSFNYAAPFFKEESAILFSRNLEGYDKKWSDWNTENKFTYTNLNNGEYNFRVKAKNIYNNVSEEAVYHFSINPPWYRTILAYFIYVILFISIVYFSIKIYTNRLKREKRKLEDIILQRTIEIEQQKEEIKTQSEKILITNKKLEKLSIVARETNNAVVIMDKEGTFEWVNEGFVKLYEYTFEEFTKEVSNNIRLASGNQSIIEKIDLCFEKKIPVHYEFHTVTRNNRDVYVQTTLTPILDYNGEIERLIAIDTEISELIDAKNEINKHREVLKKQANELEIKNKKLEKLSIVARETDNAIAILNPKGDYEWINDGYTRLYGYTLSQLKNEKVRHSIGSNSNLKVHDLVNIWYGEKRAIIDESVTKTRKGNRLWTQTTLTPIIDSFGNVTKLVAIDSDITKLKQAEEKIESQKAEIEAQRDMAIEQLSEISLQKQEIIDSIIYAKRIQNAIFPSEENLQKIFPDNFVLYLPRDIVSGDFFWIAKKGKFKIIAVADCTGHGVPGAFMSIIGITFLNEIVNSLSILKANEILNKLRKNVIISLQQTGKEGEARDGMDINLVIIDEETKSIQYAGANNSLFLIRNNILHEYKADKMPISIHRRASESFVNNEIPYSKGDQIYLFTDGFADQFGGIKEKKYKIHNLKNLLLDVNKNDLNIQKTMISNSFKEWKGRLEQVDDVLIMGIKL